MNRGRLLTIVVFLFLVFLSEVFLRMSPTTAFDTFFGERSCNLWLADEINHGKTLYADVFSQYGAFPAYSHAWLAALFGNTPETFARMQQVESLLTVVLAWILLRRCLSTESAALFLLVFIGPVLLFTAGRTAHIAPERLMLLAVALTWRPTASTTYRSIAVSGALMGAMQVVKFGGGIVAVAAWILAEICLRPVGWRELTSRWMALILGYAGITMLWAIILGLWLPWRNAVDVLWPLYMTANYTIYHADTGIRWPHWLGLKEFFALQMGPLLALALVVTMIIEVVRQPREPKADKRPADPGAFLFLGLFFVLGLFMYFRNVWLVYENCWIAILASAWAWNRLPRLPRLAVAFVFSYVAMVSVHRVERLHWPNLTHLLTMPTGDKLWATDHEAARISGVKEVVDKLRTGKGDKDAVFVVGVGSGWHHFMGWPAANRISVWVMEGFVRPYDNGPLIDSLRQTAAVVIGESMPGTDPKTWTSVVSEQQHRYPSGLPDEVCAAFAQRLGPPIVIDDTYWVYPVLPEKDWPQ